MIKLCNSIFPQECSGTRVFVSKSHSAEEKEEKPRRLTADFRTKSCTSPASTEKTRRLNGGSPTIRMARGDFIFT